MRIPTYHPRAGGRGRHRLACAAALAASLVGGACEKKQAAVAPPPPEVLVAEIVRRDVPVVMEIVGQTKGFQDIEIRARVEGYLDSVDFAEGSLVRKGQVLYHVDPRTLQATVANVKADLATATARLQKTDNDVKRLQPLAAQQAVSQQELDDAVAARTAAQAQVEAQKASLSKAELDLSYTTISSPIDGLIGTTLVKAGSLVGRSESTLLTTVSEIDPILFRAGLAEAEYLRLARRAADMRRERGGEPVPIDLILADGTVLPQKGKLDAIERAVDATTGTLTVQFRFPNPGGLVRPGQYGRARFVMETKKGALLVPQRAVQELQNLYSVAAVGADNKVAFKTVTVGPRMGSLWVVESGLEGNERVVVAGLQRLRDGLVVNAKPAPPSPEGSGQPEPAPAVTGER